MLALKNTTHCDLNEIYGALKVSGKDASKFLQGQITNDMNDIHPKHHILAALCNVQGRVLSTFRIFSLQPEEYILVLSKDLVELTLNTLKRYILRSQVNIENISSFYYFYGLFSSSDSSFLDKHNFMHNDDGIFIRYSKEPLRNLWLQTQPYAYEEASMAKIESSPWFQHNIEEKIPEITSLTSALFTALSLNFLNLEGISLTKGCYTGQEIIARTHYRGKVKEQLCFLEMDDVSNLAPGQAIFLDLAQQNCLGIFITINPSTKTALALLYTPLLKEITHPLIAHTQESIVKIKKYY